MNRQLRKGRTRLAELTVGSPAWYMAAAVTVLLIAGSAAGQTVIYVDRDSPLNGPGNDWSHAYHNLQDALAIAVPDDEIRVARGTYKPDQGAGQTPGDDNAYFEVDTAIALYGGFAGYGEPDPNERNVEAYATVLSGDLAGNDGPHTLLDFVNCLTGGAPLEPGCETFDSSGDGDVDEYDFRNWWNANGGSENSSGLLVINNPGTGVVIDGFVISGAKWWAGVSAWSDFNGTIANCTIFNNWGQDVGGGVVLGSGNATFTNCQFIANYSDGVGALQTWDADLVIDGCVFQANRGGLIARSTNTTVTNSRFIGNREASGVENMDGTITLTNCYFGGNEYVWRGAGLYNTGSAELINCTMAGNVANEGGALYSDGSTAITNSILWGNASSTGQLAGSGLTVTYSCVQGGYTGTGNISTNPGFVDADGLDDSYGTGDDDVHVQIGSPGIDAGNNAAVPTGVTTDLDGEPRFRDDPAVPDTGAGSPPVVDMGVFEFISVADTIFLGEELKMPLNSGFVIDPSKTICDPPELAFRHGMGTVADPMDDRWFAREAGVAVVTWRDTTETNSYPAVYVIAGVANPDPNDPASSHVDTVDYFPNFQEADALVGSNFAVSVLWNSNLVQDCDADDLDDVRVVGSGIVFDEDCINESNSVDPRRVLLQYDEYGNGPLVGFEVLTITNHTPTDLVVPIGRRLVQPAGADDSRAKVLANTADSGQDAAWQRDLETVDIYPIHQQTGTWANLQVVWFKRSRVESYGAMGESEPLNTWPVSVTRHRTRWPTPPEDAPAQVHVVDGDTPIGLVDLRIASIYDDVEIMNQQPFISGDPPEASIVEGRFAAINDGWTVLKFEGPGDSVTFEVVASYYHNDGNTLLPSDGGPDHILSESFVPVAIGTPIQSAGLHDPDAPGFPFGFVYASQPFASGIYPDDGVPGTDHTGQIIPVNVSNIGGAPEHGLIEVWYFMQSRETADGNFAEGISWPRFVHTYEAFQPDDPMLPEPAALEEIVIASGLGVGPDGMGCGDYGERASVYVEGLRDDDMVIQEQTIGWNPNDEHAQLISIGGDRRVFAQRSDSGWGAATGFPYVLVQHWEDGLQQWKFDVLKVAAENQTHSLSFEEFASVTAECELEWSTIWAGLKLYPPLFPINFDLNPALCGGLFAADPAGDGVWVDRLGEVWTISEQKLPADPGGIVLMNEAWLREDQALLCNPWLSGGADDPTPVVFYPTWPEICTEPPQLPCARDFAVGQTMDHLANACSVDIVWDEIVGIRLIDPTREVGIDFVELLPDFGLAAPHLASGKTGDLLQEDRIWYDYVEHQLKFRGIMSDRDHEFLTYGLLGDPLPPDYADYVVAVGNLRDATREQLQPAFDTSTLAAPHISFADPQAREGFVTLALNNESCAEPVDVQVWHAACPPYKPPVTSFSTACPFGETVIMQVELDAGGYPEQLAFHWQTRTIGESQWQDWPVSSGGELGLREIELSGPQALVDRQVRVRYRGYSGCACTEDVDCTAPGDPAWPYPASGTGFDYSGTQVSEWSEVTNIQGWLKRLTNGLNAFDSRIYDFHEIEGLDYTYLDMIEQAGPPYDGTAILSCHPDTLQSIGLIEAYETAADRVQGFTIQQRPATTAENLAIMFITARIADLYLLIANEAYADASDPTIGLDEYGGDPGSSMYSFEGIAAGLLEEELALLRGTDLDEDYPRYNRLRWNMGLEPRGEAAYVGTYNITDKDSDGFFTTNDAQIMFPQGHGDAWGHYLTAMKTYYQLLRDNNFEWITSTEFIDQTPVTYQYERRFAEAAAAKARAGAEIVNLTFRQRYDAQPATDPGFPDPHPQRAWGVADWAKRTGQAAYFDWVLANALHDDDDSEHEGIERVDRTTVPELQEIAAAFADIQATVDNAGNGLNPLGLATNVVPFGIDPGLLADGISHYEQVRCWALQELQNAKALFDYANDNIRRLRRNEDELEDFTGTIEEQNQDFNARLIEIFGRPYPEDIQTQECSGCPPGAYPAGYAGPDIFHFDYVDPSPLLAETDFATDAFTTTYTSTFTDYSDVICFSGVGCGEFTFEVPVNVSTIGLGLVRPDGYSDRPEPGTAQVLKSEWVQTIGELQQAINRYENHLAQIDTEVRKWEDLTHLNSDTLMVRVGYQQEEIGLNTAILIAHIAAQSFNVVAEVAWNGAEALAEAFPTAVGISTDATAPARSFAKLGGIIIQTAALAAGVVFDGVEAGLEHDLQEAATAADLEILRLEQDHAEGLQLDVIEQLLRESPSIRLEIYQHMEAVAAAASRYRQIVGQGVRLLDQRTAYRKSTASQVTDHRYKDFTFRFLRNESLQKYRAMFDLAARYVYLAAKAYDYDTNLPANARDYLQGVVKQRLLGVVPSGIDCDGGFGVPGPATGLADQLWQMDAAFETVDRNRFLNESTRTFSLRDELFLVDDDADWRQALSQNIRPSLSEVKEYRLYAAPIQPPYDGPALVIPFSTTVNSGLNFFGWQIDSDSFPSDSYATKFVDFQVRLPDLPEELIDHVNVYLLPAGSDVMRIPAQGDVRVWNLIDQTLPLPTVLGDFEHDQWMPWDTWAGGPQQAVARRLQPSVAATDPNIWQPDVSGSLVARSVWGSHWVLIIPGISLSNVNPQQGLESFVSGVSDIELVIDAVRYNLSVTGSESGTESDADAGTVPGGLVAAVESSK